MDLFHARNIMDLFHHHQAPPEAPPEAQFDQWPGEDFPNVKELALPMFDCDTKFEFLQDHPLGRG